MLERESDPSARVLDFAHGILHGAGEGGRNYNGEMVILMLGAR